MGKFTPEEIAYLQSQRYGRLATVSQNGELHVVPVTFRYHPEHERIDIGGENLAQTKKYRDAVRHGRVAFVVDDVVPPGTMRMIEIRGTVEGLPGREQTKRSPRSVMCALGENRVITVFNDPTGSVRGAYPRKGSGGRNSLSSADPPGPPCCCSNGKHLFKEGGSLKRLKLLSSKTTRTGTVILTYQPRKP